MAAAFVYAAVQIEGNPNKFESFMFAKVHKESGKLESLIERSVWGAADKKEWEHGVDNSG